VAFDAINAALARRVDVVILDTAGRMHTRTDLMQELAKVRRVVGKALPGAPHEALLVLDATTGQNALRQAEEFRAATQLTGIILTKLDGTARGGVVVAIADQLGLPVKLVGVGERIEDLRDFAPEAFAAALFET
jgi:fused signal recognition particle receptor